MKKVLEMKDSRKIFISILLLIIGSIFMIILPFSLVGVGSFIIFFGIVILFNNIHKKIFEIKESTGIITSFFIIIIGAIFMVILPIQFRDLGLNFFTSSAVVGLLLIAVGFYILLNIVFKDLGSH